MPSIESILTVFYLANCVLYSLSLPTCTCTCIFISDDSKASAGNVVYFHSLACLNATSLDTCVEFAVTVNGDTQTVQLEGNELKGTIPSIP